MNSLISQFGPALAGGLLIGLSAAALMFLLGRVAGISGVVGGVLSGSRESWRVGFLAGLIAGGAIIALLLPHLVVAPSTRSLPMVAAAGLLVGVGTRMGNGCTSGHGVCGIGRFSKRSIFATMTFMATGFAIATLVHVLGGAA